MEERINIKPIDMAITTGIATFIGFLLIIPLMVFTNKPSEWGFAFLFLFYFLISGIGFVGFILSILLGLISYLIVNFFVKNQISIKKNFLIKYSVICISLLIGFLAFHPAKEFVMGLNSGKEKIWEVDSNGDTKTDKWVYTNIYSETKEIDYDTKYTGKPDIWEFYKNDEVYKKEIDTDYDGKSNIREYYKNGKLVKKEMIIKPVKK